jgi:hypothetical protein
MDKKTIVLNYEQTQIVESENEKYKRIKFYSVITEENEEIYLVSEDRKDLILDVKKALAYAPRRRPLRHFQYDEVQAMRSEHIHIHLEMNVPDFYDKVECLILLTQFFHENDILTLDADRLLAVFPNLKTVCCKENIVINNVAPKLRVLDPFEVGEYSFELARAKNFKEANRYFRILRAFSHKWARFWREVATDYNRKPEDHPAYDPQGTMIYDGMDDLFKVYLLGWYPKGLPIEDDFEKVYAEKHKNFQKAIEILPIRFQNCDLHEIGEKFFWDLQYVEADSNPDFDRFFRVLAETELLFPGAAEGIYKDGWIDYDNYDQLCEHLWSMGDEMTAEAVKEMIYSGADARSIEEYLKKMSAVSSDASYVLYELYKTGHVDTMIAVQDFKLDFPELKNEEKAAEHAKKYNIKHNI